MCNMTYSYVWRDSFIYVAWPIHTCEWPMYVTWLIHMCAMTNSYVWHDSFTCVPWLIHMCAMTHSYVWWCSHTGRDSLLRDMTHSYVIWLIPTWHDSFLRDMTHSYATRLIPMWYDGFLPDMIRSYVTWLTHTWHDSLLRFFPMYTRNEEKDACHWYRDIERVLARHIWTLFFQNSYHNIWSKTKWYAFHWHSEGVSTTY